MGVIGYWWGVWRVVVVVLVGGRGCGWLDSGRCGLWCCGCRLLGCWVSCRRSNWSIVTRRIRQDRVPVESCGGVGMFMSCRCNIAVEETFPCVEREDHSPPKVLWWVSERRYGVKVVVKHHVKLGQYFAGCCVEHKRNKGRVAWGESNKDTKPSVWVPLGEFVSILEGRVEDVDRAAKHVCTLKFVGGCACLCPSFLG